jgi:hypothetical protein
MTKTNIPSQIKNSEEVKSNCYCGCLSGKEKDGKLEEKDFKISDL